MLIDAFKATLDNYKSFYFIGLFEFISKYLYSLTAHQGFQPPVQLSTRPDDGLAVLYETPTLGAGEEYFKLFE